MNKEDAYQQLMNQLDFPNSDRLRCILEYMITPDQAKMVVALPGTPQEVADKTGFTINRVHDSLDELFYKGVIIPKGDFLNRKYYRFVRSAVQFHDAVLATEELDVEKDQRLFELWYDFRVKEMYPYYADLTRRGTSPINRIIPAYRSIKDLPGILPHENFPEILKAQDFIAVVPCPCRLVAAAVGETCDFHDEVKQHVCLQFGRAADYVTTRGSGRELSIEEALKLNDIIEESGLLHAWINAAIMTGPKISCQCCRDCCIFTAPADQASLHLDIFWEKSRYQAYVNQEDCDGCQVCVDRCPFDAIEMKRPNGNKKYTAVINPDGCFGCGACVVGCEPGAIKMKTVRPPEHIPALA